MRTPERRNALLLAAAGIAATAAGVYLLTGERGEHNRERIKNWLAQAREDISDQVGKLKNVNADTVKNIVDSVLRHYPGIRNRDSVEIAQLGKDLKGYWNEMTEDTGETPTRTRSTYHHPDNE